LNHLKIITEEPINAGVSLSELDGTPLPQDRVYMRNSFPIPPSVNGEIEVAIPGQAPRIVTPAELARMPQVSVDMVLECAGNGRSLMRPVPEGLSWGLGGASPIRARGVRLVDVIGELPDEVVAVVLTGLDRGTVWPEGEVRYQFSLDSGLARSGTPLLVTHIGDQALSHERGGPVRIVVPGHYAMNSVKWLARIEGVTAPFNGHFVERFRYLGDHRFEEGTPVREIQVRSVISSPLDGALLPTGPITVEGSAWSGSGPVTKVEISADGGETWSAAELASGQGAHAAVAWRKQLIARAGEIRLMVRATDVLGQVQPEQASWNSRGYGNNLIHTIGVTVV